MPLVKEIMTPAPKMVELNEPVSECLKIMRDESCGAVPVVDENDKLQGIITDRDIALCMLDNPKPPIQVKVQDCVRLGQLIVVKPEDDLSKAIQLMEQNQVRRLPVCDNQMRCIGILSQADIVLKDPNREEVTQLVQGISQPRNSVGANP